MKLTININEQEKIEFFLSLLEELDFVEIIDFKEDGNILPEHLAVLKKRLKDIKKGEVSFKNWNSIKKKYEQKFL